MATISSGGDQQGTPIAMSFRTVRDLGDGSYAVTLDNNALQVLELLTEEGELVHNGIQAHMVAYSDGRLTINLPLPKDLEGNGLDIPQLRDQRS